MLNNYPVAFRFANVNGVPQVQVLGTTLLVNNLCQKDFGLIPLMDDPISGRVGPFSSPIYQNANDVQFWNCIRANRVYNVFRPANPVTSVNFVPIIRTMVSGNEVYPVAFVRYGFGIFLHIGLDLSAGRNDECIFCNEAVDGLIQNYLNYF